MLFFAAATVNAIVISLLVSLAVAGGFLAMFFAFLTAIYIGAVAVAVFVISVTTISATIAVIIATGKSCRFSLFFFFLILCFLCLVTFVDINLCLPLNLAKA